MNYNCNNNCDFITTTFNVISKRFRPSEDSQLKIVFNFLFKSDYLNTFESQDSTPQSFRRYLPSSTDDTSATVVVKESLSFEDIVEAIVEAVDDRLVHEDLVELVDFVWEKVNKSFPTKTLLPKFGILKLCFEIRIQHLHVSAVDSSFALLEKYEVDRVKEEKEEEEERPCCICLEELCGEDGGGAALRMPCAHVFHGGCIKGWLATSHSCPLCRYEMPT